MGATKLLFPIALAIVWVLMAAMAMVDFASFNAATRPQQVVAHSHPLKAAGPAGGIPKLAFR
jgi:hypothetical protein